MDLIDTHQHLILRGPLGYAWADAIPALAGRDFDRDDYARPVDLGGRGRRAGSG